MEGISTNIPSPFCGKYTSINATSHIIIIIVSNNNSCCRYSNTSRGNIVIIFWFNICHYLYPSELPDVKLLSVCSTPSRDYWIATFVPMLDLCY